MFILAYLKLIVGIIKKLLLVVFRFFGWKTQSGLRYRHKESSFAWKLFFRKLYIKFVFFFMEKRISYSFLLFLCQSCSHVTTTSTNLLCLNLKPIYDNFRKKFFYGNCMTAFFHRLHIWNCMIGIFFAWTSSRDFDNVRRVFFEFRIVNIGVPHFLGNLDHGYIII